MVELKSQLCVVDAVKRGLNQSFFTKHDCDTVVDTLEATFRESLGKLLQHHILSIQAIPSHFLSSSSEASKSKGNKKAIEPLHKGDTNFPKWAWKKGHLASKSHFVRNLLISDSYQIGLGKANFHPEAGGFFSQTSNNGRQKNCRSLGRRHFAAAFNSYVRQSTYTTKYFQVVMSGYLF